MSSFHKEDFFNSKIEDLMINAEKVAHVQIGHPLEHALLVLTKSGYSAVPVLDRTYRLRGLISTTMIMDSMLGIESFETEKLSELKVEDIMNSDIPRLKVNSEFLRALGLTINHPFVCIEDNEGIFCGILTRRAILKLLMKTLNNKN